MELNDIKLKNLEAVAHGLSEGNSCDDHSCPHCKLQELVQHIQGYQTLLHGILVTSVRSYPMDITYPIHLGILHGFIMAWEYRNAEELNALMQKE